MEDLKNMLVDLSIQLNRIDDRFAPLEEHLGNLSTRMDSVEARISTRSRSSSSSNSSPSPNREPSRSRPVETPEVLRNVGRATHYRSAYDPRRASNLFGSVSHVPLRTSAKVYVQKERSEEDDPKLLGQSISIRAVLAFSNKLREEMDTEGNVEYLVAIKCLSHSQRISIKARMVEHLAFRELANDMFWQGCPAQQLLDLLQAYVAVKSTSDFIEALEENAKFKC
jgi:hypothetical protein